MSKKKTVSAGRLYLIECESAGARPAAVVTWYKNNRFLGKTDSKASLDVHTLEPACKISVLSRES